MYKPLVRLSVLLAVALTLSACANISYYAQSLTGQLEVMRKRQLIQRLLRAPDTPAPLKAQLADVLAIRQFAVQTLHLPDNASYQSYADLHRPYVVWNVVATPAFSLQPLRWCFPFAGCLSYRGYFDKQRANAFALELQQRGDDVAVMGVPAYSTLGWFDDPVLNTVLNWPEPRLAGLIFHELAHQELYVRDDSSFNESFAVTVEEEGVRRWLERRHDTAGLQQYRVERQRQTEFLQLIQRTRADLLRVYALPLSDTERQRAKTQVFATLQARYRQLKHGWRGYAGYDRWFAQDLNNAHIAALNTYHAYVPAFQALLAREHGDLVVFYHDARQLAQLPAAARAAQLHALGLH